MPQITTPAPTSTAQDTSVATSTESLDTNVILRLITKDIPSLYQQATDLLRRPNVDFYLDDLAISEAIYVLESPTYHYPRPQIVDSLLWLFELPNLYLSGRDVLVDALQLYLTHPALSFNDCYLAVKSSLLPAIPLWTFDRKLAAQAPSTRLVNG